MFTLILTLFNGNPQQGQLERKTNIVDLQVFSGSIFEGAPHAPTVLVKLLYHWACQTSVNNISAWVKVDGLYVKSFYTNIRSVCTAAIHEKFEKLGGPKKRVEVSVSVSYFSWFEIESC